MLPSAADPDTGRADPAKLLQAARLAEAAGFDGAYIGDHLLHPHPILESVVSLAAVAARTERIRIGPCVMLVALRDPTLLAKQLATLAAYAPGRLRVGVGVGGEYPGEFAAAGVALARRGERTDAALRAVRRLLSEGVDQPGVVMEPRAPDVAFFAGGHSERALARAASTDGWIGYLLGADSFARRRTRLLELSERPGFSTGMLLPCHVEDSPRAAESAARAWSRLTDSGSGIPERLFCAGSAARVADQLHAYWQQGCNEFMLGVTEQGGRYLDQAERLGGEVLPLLRQFR